MVDERGEGDGPSFIPQLLSCNSRGLPKATLQEEVGQLSHPWTWNKGWSLSQFDDGLKKSKCVLVKIELKTIITTGSGTVFRTVIFYHSSRRPAIRVIQTIDRNFFCEALR